ncbi:saccharopepsin [Ranunculus cassubicifolius]
MDVSLILIFSSFFISATTISLASEEPVIHLTLHHAHHHLSSTSDLLARDEARVRFMNHRRSTSKSKTNTSTHTVAAARGGGGGGGVSIGVKPGGSLGVGNYYVKLGLGTPVTYYNMVVDTGSSLTWLQCQPCVVYCHPQIGPVFDPSKSSTHKYVPCSAPECSKLEAATRNPSVCLQSKKCVYEARYGDGSYSIGYLSKETLTLSVSRKSTVPEFVFGCGEDSEGLFGKSSGLIGFARNSLSMSAQLASKYGFVFSYCLPSTTSIASNNTGTFSIGRTSSIPYSFTPMITNPKNPSLYYLKWTGMTLSGKPLAGVSLLQYRNTPTIIDSGTVISRIPATVYETLRGQFVKAMSLRYARAPDFSILDACYYTRGSNTGVPEVSFVFDGGVQLKLGPKNVLIDVGKGVSCLAFAGYYATGGLAIIGNKQQQTFRVLYDVSNSKIGFASGGCD